ncbi:MAG: hypothetical protein AB7F43_11400 [Bacteriovoracia bacterium]
MCRKKSLWLTVLMLAYCVVIETPLVAQSYLDYKIENEFCWKKKGDGWVRTKVENCGIDPKHPTREEFKVVNNRCQRVRIFESENVNIHGSIEVNNPMEVIPPEKCISNKKPEIDYVLASTKCVKIETFSQKHGQRVDTIRKVVGEVDLSQCGIDLSQPSEEEFVRKKGWIWDDCFRVQRYTSYTEKGVYQKQEKVPVSECKKFEEQARHY